MVAPPRRSSGVSAPANSVHVWTISLQSPMRSTGSELGHFHLLFRQNGYATTSETSSPSEWLPLSTESLTQANRESPDQALASTAAPDPCSDPRPTTGIRVCDHHSTDGDRESRPRVGRRTTAASHGRLPHVRRKDRAPHPFGREHCRYRARSRTVRT